MNSRYILSSLMLSLLSLLCSLLCSLPIPVQALAPTDEGTDSNQGVIGVHLIKASSPADGSGKDFLVIDTIIPGTPAEQAGLQVGDVIQAVDSVAVGSQTHQQIGQALKGKVGTPVTVSVLRNKKVLSFTCTRVKREDLPAQSRNAYDVSSPDLVAQLNELERKGFGMTSITDINGTVKSDHPQKTENILGYLRPRSQVTAESYLKLPATGVWSGAQAQEQFEQFRKYVEPADESTAAYHFVMGTHALAEKNYADAVAQLSAAVKEYPALSTALRLRALAQYKLGNIAQAKKDWKDSAYLDMPTSQLSDQWLKNVVVSLRDHWHITMTVQPERLRKMPSKQIVLTVTIEKDGRVSQVQITQSCGDAALDETAKTSCLKASPVEPPPASLSIPVALQLEFKREVTYKK